MRIPILQTMIDGARGVRRQPLRNALLTLTFALGFSLVIIVIGTIEGGRQQIRDTLHAMGIDVIAVLNPIQIEGIPFLKLGHGGERPIDRAAIEELQAEFGDEARTIAPMRLELTSTSRPDRGFSSNTLIATSPEYTTAIQTGLLAGRFLEDTDYFIDGGANNVVFDEALARFFEPDDPAKVIGQIFASRRHGEAYQAIVVGVMKDPIVLRKHMDLFDSQSKARKLTARRLEFLNTYVLFDPRRDEPSGVIVQAHDSDQVEPLLEKLVPFFESRNIEPYYHVQKRWVTEVLAVVDRFSFLLHFIWGLALVVVLILTATITTIAIEERFAEVAIHRVEGASAWRVVSALLAESVWITAVSAPLGFAIAHVTLDRYVTDRLWPPVIPEIAVWGTPLLLLGTAFLAYGIPAYRVAKLEPAQVLGDNA
ncbi:MAG: ABC transporter permease [Planctomycetota bacterium]